MSAWVKGKLNLDCSLDVLRRAISSIHPEWEKHIQVDPSGKIPMYRYNGQKHSENVQLLIPGPGNPKYNSCPNRGSENDWGFNRSSDGTWETVFADFHNKEANQLAERCKGEVLKMKALILAKLKGYPVESVKREKGRTIIDLKVDRDQAKKMQTA